MVFKSLHVQVILRVSGIVVNAVILAWLLVSTRSWYTVVTLGIILILQAWLLVRYFNRTNRIMGDFIQRLREKENTSRSLMEIESGPFMQFSQVLHEINELIQDARIEKENQFLYLKYIIEHVGIGLLAFDEKGKINLVNKAALALFHLKELTHIKNLNLVREGMDKSLKEIKPGQQQLMKTSIAGSIIQLSVKASEFRILDRWIKLVSFQDIKGELDQKELESWQKLIRVLAHEIMNSITPINTLIETMIKQNLQHEGTIRQSQVGGEYYENMTDGLQLIRERGSGLIDFVQKYRDLSRLPTPNLTEIKVSDLLGVISRLFEKDIEEQQITLSTTINPDNLSITADRKLIEQVLINLVRNAMEALHGQEDGQLRLLAEKNKDAVRIKVSDNGPGIPESIIDQVFIPFYTTKEEGSGIGLSLSRQIMRLHQGTIDIQTTPLRETNIILNF
jgi:nitrogen fixation/metabolism regulation signal transduction histidine kinase